MNRDCPLQYLLLLHHVRYSFFASGVPEKRANDKIMTTIFILYPLIIMCYFLRWLNFDFEFILFEIIYETVCAINILYESSLNNNEYEYSYCLFV